MAKTTASDDTMKRAALRLLAQGRITKSEAARLAGVSRQLMNVWAWDIADARPDYLTRIWRRATGNR